FSSVPAKAFMRPCWARGSPAHPAFRPDGKLHWSWPRSSRLCLTRPQRMRRPGTGQSSSRNPTTRRVAGGMAPAAGPRAPPPLGRGWALIPAMATPAWPCHPPAILEWLKAFAHHLQKLADVRPIRIAFEPREARPAEAKTQVIDERQLVGLVREDGVGPGKW